MLKTVRGLFAREAVPMPFDFLFDPAEPPVEPQNGYVRIWLAEGFLRAARTWTNDQFPAVHGGATLAFGSGQAEFTQFNRSPDVSKMAGVQVNFPLTPLLPYSGGIVEVRAALYQATRTGPLGTAVSIAASLASLAGPPLATAAAVAGKVGAGLGEVLAATGDKPVLSLHCSLEPPGGGGRLLRPGHLVVANTPAEKLPGQLRIIDGFLHADGPGGLKRLSGCDFLTVRIECRAEPDNWFSPPLLAQIDAAANAYLMGDRRRFRGLRTAAIASAWTSTDFVIRDRKRLAKLAEGMIDDVMTAGAVPSGSNTAEEMIARWLPPIDDPQTSALELEDLIG